MNEKNFYEFSVDFFTKSNSLTKVVRLTPDETANLYRFTFRMPLSAPVDLNSITESEFSNMLDELGYQYLYCYLGDPAATFDPSLLPEWIVDCFGK